MDGENQNPAPSDEGQDNSNVNENATGSDEATPVAPTVEAAPPPKKEGNKKVMMIVIVVILTILLGAGVWWFMSGSDSTDTANQDTNTEASTEDPIDDASSGSTGLGMLNEIVYAHSENSNTARPMFYRELPDGEREDLNGSIPSYNKVFNVVRQGEHYVYADGKDIYYGQGQNAQKKVHTFNDNSRSVTQMALSADGSKVLVGLGWNASSGNIPDPQLWIVPTGSGSATMIFEGNQNDSVGLYPVAIDSATDYPLYFEWCIGCGGGPIESLYTLEQGLPVEVLSMTNSATYLANADVSKIAWIEGTAYSQSQMNKHNITPGISTTIGPPYKLHVHDVASGQSSVVKTFGIIEDAANDANVSVNLFWGSDENGEQIAYSYQNKVHLQNNSGNFSNVFESGQGVIQTIYWATDKEVLVGTPVGNSGLSELITHFNIDEVKANTVMETGDSTAILALTSQ